jgi:hypothetical protein
MSGSEVVLSEWVQALLPPPVEGGTGFYGSRGRLIDWLMGDQRIRARVRNEYSVLVASSEHSESEGKPSPPPADPPPTQLPPPVLGGTGIETRGSSWTGRRPQAAD